jgi:hypothetical protein
MSGYIGTLKWIHARGFASADEVTLRAANRSSQACDIEYAVAAYDA